MRSGSAGEVFEKLIHDGFLLDYQCGFTHRGAEFEIPWRVGRATVEGLRAGAGGDRVAVVVDAQAPWLGMVSAKCFCGHLDARPVEVAVVAERAAPSGCMLDQAGNRDDRSAVVDQRRAALA